MLPNPLPSFCLLVTAFFFNITWLKIENHHFFEQLFIFSYGILIESILSKIVSLSSWKLLGKFVSRVYCKQPNVFLICQFGKKECVTSTASKSFESAIDVADVAIVIVVTYTLHFFVMFLKTSTSKWTNEFSIKELSIIQKNNERQKVVNFWNIVHLSTLKIWRMSFFDLSQK